jgi:GeoRSP system radical SAM/SPASM protein
MKANYLSSPLIVNWGLTARCNFFCSHCFSRLDTSSEINTEQAMRVSDILADSGVMIVNFGTGEPLLRSDLFKIAANCRARGLRVTMNTNGSLIDGKAVEKIVDAGFTSVGISIDSANGEVHDRFRNHPGSFEKAVGAARLLRQAGVPLTISSVICKINHLDYPRLLDLAIQLGAGTIDFHNFKCSGMGGRNSQKLDLTPDEWKIFYTKALPLKEQRKDIDILFDDPVISLIRDDDGRVVNGSVCGKVSLYISPDGSVTPCGFIPVTIGNILEDSLLDLWERSPVLGAMRNKKPEGKCRTCDTFTSCLGGCTARAYATGSSFSSPDPHCWLEEEEN